MLAPEPGSSRGGFPCTRAPSSSSPSSLPSASRPAAPGAAEGPRASTRGASRSSSTCCCSPEEQALLKELKDDKDRREFQKIFWARRDPTPGTPANEFEDVVRAVWKRADELFSYPNQKGSETGCGQVLALLGRPEEVLGKGDVPRRRPSGPGQADGSRAPARPGRQFDNMAYLREGSTARAGDLGLPRPARPARTTSPRAELRVAFDSECRFAEGGILAEDLQRAASALVTRPEIALQPRERRAPRAARGRRGGAAAGAGAGARALLAAPRKDFPLAAETKLLMRGPKGEAYVAGLVRASAGAAGDAPVRFSLAAQAADAGGQVVASAAREVAAPPEADGSLVASWGLSLKPGRYTVTVAALLTASRPGLGEHAGRRGPRLRRRGPRREPARRLPRRAAGRGSRGRRATPTPRCSSGRCASARASATCSRRRTR